MQLSHRSKSRILEYCAEIKSTGCGQIVAKCPNRPLSCKNARNTETTDVSSLYARHQELFAHKMDERFYSFTMSVFMICLRMAVLRHDEDRLGWVVLDLRTAKLNATQETYLTGTSTIRVFRGRHGPSSASFFKLGISTQTQFARLLRDGIRHVIGSLQTIRATS